MAFAVAASANLPVLLYSLYWRRFNTAGAVSALTVGLCSALAMMAIGPAFIGSKGLFLHGVQPLSPFTNPGIVSIPLGFLAGWLGTLATAREERSEQAYRELRTRALTGFGAEVGEHA